MRWDRCLKTFIFPRGWVSMTLMILHFFYSWNSLIKRCAQPIISQFIRLCYVHIWCWAQRCSRSLKSSSCACVTFGLLTLFIYAPILYLPISEPVWCCSGTFYCQISVFFASCLMMSLSESLFRDSSFTRLLLFFTPYPIKLHDSVHNENAVLWVGCLNFMTWESSRGNNNRGKEKKALHGN